MKRNIVISGCGRSGTSMLASLFEAAGYNYGSQLHAPSKANPFGYYEDRRINRINTHLIQAYWSTQSPDAQTAQVVQRDQASWLCVPRVPPTQWSGEVPLQAMSAFVNQRPFCLKDPRFTVTLPAWRAVLSEDVVHLVIFRDPVRTVDSILRDACETYDPPLPIDATWAYEQWYRTYAHLLHRLPETAAAGWFINDQDITDVDTTAMLTHVVGVEPDLMRVRPRVRRAHADVTHDVPDGLRDQCEQLHARLALRAQRDAARNFTPRRASMAS